MHALLLLTAACGARTGLDAPPRVADAGAVDAAAPPAACAAGSPAWTPPDLTRCDLVAGAPVVVAPESDAFRGWVQAASTSDVVVVSDVRTVGLDGLPEDWTFRLTLWSLAFDGTVRRATPVLAPQPWVSHSWEFLSALRFGTSCGETIAAVSGSFGCRLFRLDDGGVGGGPITEFADATCARLAPTDVGAVIATRPFRWAHSPATNSFVAPTVYNEPSLRFLDGAARLLGQTPALWSRQHGGNARDRWIDYSDRILRVVSLPSGVVALTVVDAAGTARLDAWRFDARGGMVGAVEGLARVAAAVGGLEAWGTPDGADVVLFDRGSTGSSGTFGPLWHVALDREGAPRGAPRRLDAPTGVGSFHVHRIGVDLVLAGRSPATRDGVDAYWLQPIALDGRLGQRVVVTAPPGTLANPVALAPTPQGLLALVVAYVPRGHAEARQRLVAVPVTCRR